MKVLNDKNDKRFYRMLKRSLIILFLSVVLICTVPFSYQYRQIMLEKVEEANISAITQSRNATATMSQICNSITDQVFGDLNIAWLLYGTEYDPVQLNISMAQLNGYRASIPYIDSIYIYNGLTRTMSVSSSYNGMYGIPVDGEGEVFFDREIVDIIQNESNRGDRFKPIPRRLTVTRGGMEEELLLFTFMRTVSFGNDPISSTVFINFSYSWLEQMTSLNEPGEYVTLIIDQNGRVVSDTDTYPMGLDVTGESFYSSICERPENTGSFTDSLNGQPTMVSFIPEDGNGWRYIRLVPEEYVNRGYTTILTFMAAVMAFIVVLGLLVTLLLSRMLYLPVDRVHVEKKALEEKNRRIERLSKQHVLRNSLFGTGGNLSVMKNDLMELNITADAKAYYQIVLIKIKNYRLFVSRHDSRDQSLWRYGVMNIVSELSRKQFQSELVDIGEENEIVLLLSMQERLDWTKAEWEAFLIPVSDAVLGALDIEINFIVSRSCQGLEAVPAVYQKTKEAGIYRILYGGERVLMVKWFKHFKSSEYAYPTAREEAMVEAVIAGKADKAKEILAEILYDTAEYPYAVINLAVAKVALSLNMLVREMQKGHFLELSQEVNAAIFSATEMNEETIPSFNRAIDEIVAGLEGRRSAKHADLISEINRQIETGFSNPDCSMEGIAQAVSMSATHMGRLYKRYTMKSIPESILAVRMENARRLLKEEKRISVAEVARRSGFSSSSYFSKAFRKEHGMTPGEFRNHIHVADKPAEENEET